MNEELKALQKVFDELEKIYVKYQAKANKERVKVNDVYVIIKGEKCYTEQEVNELIEADVITANQADKYIEKLEAKKKKVGENNGMTASERICTIIFNLRTNINIEIGDIKKREQEKQDKAERWKVAQAQGCSYLQFLELEEINRKSEEYEENDGRK